jgi:hypothetical protein
MTVVIANKFLAATVHKLQYCTLSFSISMKRFEIIFCVLLINYCNWDEFSFLRLVRLSDLFHSAAKFKIVSMAYGVAAESIYKDEKINFFYFL